jgi:diguanylate cyclase (GGDEF)-like protein
VNEETAPIGAQQQNDFETPDSSGDDRDRSAEDRDYRAEAHDRESATRDKSGEARDQRAEARDVAVGETDAAAASDRSAAFRDRQGAARDRKQSADDREAAAGDRLMSARERHFSSVDELTGAYRRDPGLVELEREMARAKRTDRLLVLAFVDVDGLKATNDSLGHAAGDQLLRAAVARIFTRLRSYDLIVRFGGDEFVCLLLDVNMPAAAERFEGIQKDLFLSQEGSITVGLAEMRLDDSLEDLLARADRALYHERKESPGN